MQNGERRRGVPREEGVAGRLLPALDRGRLAQDLVAEFTHTHPEGPRYLFQAPGPAVVRAAATQAVPAWGRPWAREIAVRHGGSLTLAPTGPAFTVRLPLPPQD
ncbi:hypothetical protein ABH931_006986 [Streptacidiphilus sp. MAP12-33]|uniref:hypothetical protein n=1 Tax=Streptacidiphilus sp. MAP12-33 TaxID=3156266 RepID=UPI003516318A